MLGWCCTLKDCVRHMKLLHAARLCTETAQMHSQCSSSFQEAFMYGTDDSQSCNLTSVKSMMLGSRSAAGLSTLPVSDWGTLSRTRILCLSSAPSAEAGRLAGRPAAALPCEDAVCAAVPGCCPCSSRDMLSSCRAGAWAASGSSGGGGGGASAPSPAASAAAGCCCCCCCWCSAADG